MTIISHRDEVCRLYRAALRLAFDWIIDRPEERRFALAVRKQFDVHRTETDPQRVKLLKDTARYLLWEYRHPEPYKYPTAPGGVAYDRQAKYDHKFVKHGYNPDLETY